MLMPELVPMSLARPRILNLSFTVCCRYRHGCSTFRWSELLVAAFPGPSAKIPKTCSVTHHVAGWNSHKERRCQRFYCNASQGLELEQQVVQDVDTHERSLVPDEFVDDRLSPFAASAKRLRGLLTDSDIWADVKTWVVFSDLHLSRRTSNTCLEVLRTVHAQASARNAGIIFLGDFWHARGALPVELLNLAIAELQTWTCPTIFIPGNHDQVNMGGEVHALTVLEATNYYIKVISEPTEYLGALWLPFRRDHDVIKDAVTRSSGATAIFGHLDVIGAYMNEQRQASDGVDPAMFPPTLPVFTGHYHKPHVVDNSRVEYIGSPYQVSASESGQRKRFLLLNQQWDKLDEIPVDIGPRHYTFEDKVLNLQSLEGLRNGDRVKWLLSTETLSNDVKKHVAKLRREGVHIELIYPSIAPKPRIEKAEDLDAFSLFKLYAKNGNMSEGATNKALDILHGLNLPANLIKRPQVHLVFKSVEIEGFGPFVEPVKYPLAQRGFRVVSGKVVDSMGADSNGAGKTTLVMAPLWAITGSTDPRPDSSKGLTAADVMNKRSKRARVQVEGTVNEKPFMIERTTNSRKATLRFMVDGMDKTCQEIKLTQELIDEFLNTALLERAVFHGQHGVHGLLEASDKTFKEELSKVLALDIWSHAREQSKADLRDVGNKIQQMEGALGELSERYKQLSNEVKLSKERVQDWENTQARKISRIGSEVESTRDTLRNLLSECKTLCERVESSIKEWGPFGSNLEQYVVPVSNSAELLNDTWKTKRFEERELLVRRSAELAVEVRNAQADKQEKLATLEEFNNVTKTLVCERCLQEIPPDHVSKHMTHFRSEAVTAVDIETYYRHKKDETSKQLESLTATINEERQRVEKALASQKEKTAKISARVQIVWEAIASAQLCVEKANMFISQHGPVLGEGVTGGLPHVDASPGTECNEAVLLDDSIEKKLGHFKTLVSELLSKVAIGEKGIQKLQNGQRDLEGARNERNLFAAQYGTLSDMHRKASNQLERQLSSLEEAKQSAQWLKDVDAAFGHSGIQSYVLEGAVAELQERTARFVQALSGGSLGLLLNSTKQQKTKRGTTDNIEKIPLKRMEDGSLEHWSLAQLSGGERRRLALGLELGYAELAAERGGLHSDLLVVDEVMQHLDSEGKVRALSVLRGLPHGTILLVSQAHSDVAEGFDLVDVVVKQDHAATVELAEGL